MCAAAPFRHCLCNSLQSCLTEVRTVTAVMPQCSTHRHCSHASVQYTPSLQSCPSAVHTITAVMPQCSTNRHCSHASVQYKPSLQSCLSAVQTVTAVMPKCSTNRHCSHASLQYKPSLQSCLTAVQTITAVPPHCSPTSSTCLLDKHLASKQFCVGGGGPGECVALPITDDLANKLASKGLLPNP
jgi:hypothetical protein